MLDIRFLLGLQYKIGSFFVLWLLISKRLGPCLLNLLPISRLSEADEWLEHAIALRRLTLILAEIKVRSPLNFSLLAPFEKRLLTVSFEFPFKKVVIDDWYQDEKAPTEKECLQSQHKYWQRADKAYIFLYFSKEDDVVHDYDDGHDHKATPPAEVGELWCMVHVDQWGCWANSSRKDEPKSGDRLDNWQDLAPKHVCWEVFYLG